MRDLDYLELLSESFPDKAACRTEIINLNAILGLPKGTEYFFSDIHGEDKAFVHMLRSSSGVIRKKINILFSKFLPETELQELAELIYYPERVLQEKIETGEFTREWQSMSIYRLIKVCREVSAKYTRSKVRKKMPKDYAYILEELLTVDENGEDKDRYFRNIIDTIVDTDGTEIFITELCNMIHILSIDQLHILGDLFDRGPHPDNVIEEMMKYPDVDFVLGNHDAAWVGASLGNEACIFNVLRTSTRYDNFDILQDGYGINLRALTLFAENVYRDDSCEYFKPTILDENEYDSVDPLLAARMQKACAVIQMKLEGQLIRRHPEYGMDDRIALEKIDYEKGTVLIDGKTYELLDKNFPTVDPKDPLALTREEKAIVELVKTSFLRSKRLQKHIRFFMERGRLYRTVNGNLLYHGCIPMKEDGSFLEVDLGKGPVSGKVFFDDLEKMVSSAYNDPSGNKTDVFWYLWCGPKSPLFGKSKMATFESSFLSEKEAKKEEPNPYYKLIDKKETAEKILSEFGIDPEKGHVIFGHVPVKEKAGESAMKAGGKAFLIDGGIAKAYHEKTGISGYTLIFNSHYLSLAAHESFEEGKEKSPRLEIVEYMNPRIRVADTDLGKKLQKQADDLQELLTAYRDGRVKEKPKKKK